MKFICRKEFGKLIPVDDIGADALKKLKHGAEVQIEMRQKRNLKHFRLYWALINLVFDNQERFTSPQQIHNALKEAAGLYETQMRLDGKPMRVLSSTSFEDMDQAAFAKYYDQCCDILAKTFLPTITGAKLKREVEIMLGAADKKRAA